MREQEAKWYVYELVNPLTNKVFYVGKGNGKRMYDHEKEARKRVCSKKTNIINDIEAHGLNYLARKKATFWCEKEAFRYERKLIAEYPDLANIRNNKIKEIIPFTPAIAMNAIMRMPQWFAFWYEHYRNEPSVKIEVNHFQYNIWNKLYGAAIQTFFNKLARKTINKALEDTANHGLVIDTLKNHQIDFDIKEFSYGGA